MKSRMESILKEWRENQSHSTYHYADFELLSTIGVRESEDKVSVERCSPEDLIPVTTIARNAFVRQSILNRSFVTDVEVHALNDHEHANPLRRCLPVVLVGQCQSIHD